MPPNSPPPAKARPMRGRAPLRRPVATAADIDLPYVCWVAAARESFGYALFAERLTWELVKLLRTLRRVFVCFTTGLGAPTDLLFAAAGNLKFGSAAMAVSVSPLTVVTTVLRA